MRSQANQVQENTRTKGKGIILDMVKIKLKDQIQRSSIFIVAK